MIRKSFIFVLCIQFFKQCVSVTLQCDLAFVMKKKIALTRDVCSRPLIIFRSHDLHCDIRKAMGEIASTMKRTNSLPSFILAGCASIGLFFGLPFCLSCDGFGQQFLLDFLSSLVLNIMNPLVCIMD